MGAQGNVVDPWSVWSTAKFNHHSVKVAFPAGVTFYSDNFQNLQSCAERRVPLRRALSNNLNASFELSLVGCDFVLFLVVYKARSACHHKSWDIWSIYIQLSSDSQIRFVARSQSDRTVGGTLSESREWVVTTDVLKELMCNNYLV